MTKFDCMTRNAVFILLISIISFLANAEGGWGQYRLFGKAYSNGSVLVGEQIQFIQGKDTAIVTTDSSGNFEMTITWKTFDRMLMVPGIDLETENQKLNPLIFAIWKDRSILIANRWKEAQEASFKNKWIDIAFDLNF
jgi:hypothetical protein